MGCCAVVAQGRRRKSGRFKGPPSRPPDVLWTLAFSAFVSGLAALAFAYAGTRFLSRGLGGERRASRAFAAWWMCLAAYLALQGFDDVLGAVGAASLAVFSAVRYATLVLVCAAFAGLAHYVLFVRTGDERWVPRVWGYYGLLAAVFVGIVASARPDGAVIQRWRTDVSLATPVNAPLFAAGLLLAILPVLAAVVAYLRLRRRTHDEIQRRRILVVGTGMLLALVAMAVSRASNNDAFQLVARPTLGVGVALAIARAFHEPRPPPDPAAQSELERRVRELV